MQGLVPNLSNDDYHAAPGISSSGLSLINAKSLAHYWAKYRDPDREITPKSAVFKAGTTLHCMILEPDAFAERYVALPPDAPDRPTEAMLNAKTPSASSIARQDYWAQFTALAAGREIIDGADYERYARIADRIHRHPTVRELIGGGVDAEQSVFGTDPETGELCKCRPDWRPRAHNVLIDIKSAEDASTDGFMRAAKNYGYRVSSAFYPDVMEWAGLTRPDAMFYIAFEKEAPFEPHFFEPTERFVERGRVAYRKALNAYAKASEDMRRTFTPAAFTTAGYGNQIEPLDVFDWEK